MSRIEPQQYLDFAPVIFVALDIDGNIMVANKKTCQLLRCGRDQIIGKNWFENFLPEEIRPAIRQFHQQLIASQTGTITYHENPIVALDGKQRIIAWHNMPICDDSGKVTGMLAAGEDITEKKLIEEDLENARKQAKQMAEQADKANHAKGEFLAHMSHEIRTPMNAIIGFSEILSEQQLTAEQAEYVGIIKQSSENLLEIINDILDFSKIESGILDMDIMEFSLDDLIIAIAALMGHLARQKQLDFKVIPQTSLPERIKTDPARLRQCLINLLSNAIKFTERGHVYLYLRYQRAGDKAELVFDVEDTGIGIPHDKQAIIFNAFTQVDAGTARKYGGTGLGLAITKQLTEILGGKLSLKSAAGKGSVFTIVLNTELLTSQQRMLGQQDFLHLINLENMAHAGANPDMAIMNEDKAAEELCENEVAVIRLNN
ncbi:MAG: ATP-binding protein [Phycisphaerae bacterium]|jgi:PAS domain S-box-containing protein